jgi:hypothetical protein
MALYWVYFTSEVEGRVPVEAESEEEAMRLFNHGQVRFSEMEEVNSETSDAEYAERDDDADDEEEEED